MRGTIAIALVFGMAAPAIAADPPSGDVASLRAFADAFDVAQIAQDRGALDRMVADDLVFIDGSGKRYDKAFFIDGWTGPDDDYDPVTLTDRVIQPLGKNAGIASAETVLSQITTSGLIDRQRAIAIRCRCPPDTLMPRSPTMVAMPSRRLSMKSQRAAIAARNTSSSVAFGRHPS